MATGGKVLTELLRQVMVSHPAECESCRGYKSGAFERITSKPEWTAIMQAMEDEEDRLPEGYGYFRGGLSL